MIGVNIGAGLGNRMFQLAYIYSLAKKHGLQFRLENWQRTSHHSHNIYDWLIQRFMALPNYQHTTVQYDMEIIEAGDDFTTYIDRYCTEMAEKSVYLYGFFQNEHYFKEYRDELLELFKEPEFVTQQITNGYNDICSLLENAYFLHLRLGDYVGHYKHWIHLENYYLRVLEKIPLDCPILLFTNSWHNYPIVYPRLTAYLQNRDHICIRDTDEVRSLYLMSRCRRGGICSNSTFGWWAGWLNGNPEKVVYMPGQWMTDANFKCYIYPEWATIIEV